jgi:hypothetical protein
MISFIDFLNVKLGNQDEHLTKQVIAMFPTFVDYGFMTKTDNDEYILTNRGNNAFTTLLCGVFFNDTLPFRVQLQDLAESGILAYHADKDEYVATIPGLISLLSVMLYTKVSEEVIVKCIYDAEKCYNEVYERKKD